MKAQGNSTQSINRFFFVNYVLMLVNLADFARFITYPDIGTIVFTAIIVLAYGFVYLIPAGLVLATLGVAARLFRIAEKWYVRFFIYTAAVILLTLTHLVILADRIIYKMYGFHFNGFVWNILTTKGGIESMGFDAAAYWTSAGVFLAAVTAEIFLLVMCIRWQTVKVARLSKTLHYMRIAVPYTAGLMFAVQAVFFGISSFKGDSDVLVAAQVFPFYMPITFQGVLKNMGFQSARNTVLTADHSEDLELQYPLQTIRQRPDSPRYNIVWLVAESWRADMLTEEIMPQTYRFAKKAQCFKNHYSSGNGTRPAMFSMFYGLYGNCWPAFLREQHPPVLMDLLQQNGYQIELYTSARFTYPEFDKTIFSHVPAEQLHEYAASVGWKSDRKNVSRLLNFMDSRDKNRPFMTFLFFESPHARYYFPPECEVKKDYLKEFNYVTADIRQDIGLIFNRYINSCNHLDTQYARIIDYLEEKGLLDTTIVIITGDHGEEFMEHGRWGHNSAFVEEQVMTPLVIWVPGRKPAEYAKMTSHLDIPATIMRVLGVENPPEDFSLGMDMFSDEKRQFTVFSDWNSMVYMDNEYKIVLPLKASAHFETLNEVSTADDRTVADGSAVFSKKLENLVRVLHDSSKFTKIHQDER